MKIRPTGHRILVKVEMSELVKRTKASGLVLTEAITERENNAEQTATVVEIGPDAYKDFHSPWCKTGDKVMIARYAGISKDDIEEGFIYRVINDEDVVATIED